MMIRAALLVVLGGHLQEHIYRRAVNAEEFQIENKKEIEIKR